MENVAKINKPKINSMVRVIFYCMVYTMVAIFALFLFLPLFGIKIFVVETDSMRPSLNEGEVVVVKRTTNVKVGDIVTFTQPLLGNVTHRLVAIVEDGGNIYYLCAGDNSLDIPWQELAEKLKMASSEERFSMVDNVIVKENIIGVVKYKLKKIGKLIVILQNYKLLIISVLLLIIFILNYSNNYLKGGNKYLNN